MDEIITLDYGSGGKKTSELIDGIIVSALSNDALSELSDGAVVNGAEKLVFSTDSFVVSPYIFPGGDIGKLAVCGTVNDVAMSGGVPKYLSLSFIIEEGFPTAALRRIVASISETAKKAGVLVVTGDTKVVERGRGDGIYINTAGIGFLKNPDLSPKNLRKGDVVILSGTCGDHGAGIMLARNKSLAEGEILSDCAPLNALCEKLYPLGDALRVLRDPTRGGVATTLCEFAESSSLSIELSEEDIPVRGDVRAVCDLLGLDPLYSANEGKLLAVVSPDHADEALRIMKSTEEGKNAAVIGHVTSRSVGKVYVKGEFGSRIVTKLTGALLPRIC
ncbi:MAG: hydrogenase expression/formation protein HypE [Oscillospiraceae bacterium]|nr:hydrogenase expression/formation protein HypE [Oscillospiraceae bacterium]